MVHLGSIARKKEQYSADKSVRNLFDGSLLGNPQAWLLSLSDQNFNEVISALREVLSIEGEFDVIQRSHEKQECYIVTKTGNTHIRTPSMLHPQVLEQFLRWCAISYKG
jgi:hypothetical protein